MVVFYMSHPVISLKILLVSLFRYFLLKTLTNVMLRFNNNKISRRRCERTTWVRPVIGRTIGLWYWFLRGTVHCQKKADIGRSMCRFNGINLSMLGQEWVGQKWRNILVRNRSEFYISIINRNVHVEKLINIIVVHIL